MAEVTHRPIDESVNLNQRTVVARPEKRVENAILDHQLGEITNET